MVGRSVLRSSVQSGRDLFYGNHLPLAHAGARCRGLCRRPCLGRRQVFRPERPRAALRRPRLVQPAQGCARPRLAIKKDAVVAMFCKPLSQAETLSNASGESLDERLDVQPDRRGHVDCLVGREPHGPRRPCAAVAAHGALECQAVSIPEVRSGHSHPTRPLHYPSRARCPGAPRARPARPRWAGSV